MTGPALAGKGGRERAGTCRVGLLPGPALPPQHCSPRPQGGLWVRASKWLSEGRDCQGSSGEGGGWAPHGPPWRVCAPTSPCTRPLLLTWGLWRGRGVGAQTLGFGLGLAPGVLQACPVRVPAGATGGPGCSGAGCWALGGGGGRERSHATGPLPRRAVYTCLVRGNVRGQPCPMPAGPWVRLGQRERWRPAQR